MPVTLNDVDIETVTSIRKLKNPRMNSLPLGFHSLLLSQSVKNMLVQYEVSGVWSQGDADYDSKERVLKNYNEGGLPVWFDGTSWRKNALVFGRISDFETTHDEKEVDITRFSFLVTSVFPWGYVYITDHGLSTFKIYDLDRFVQSETINPIERRCNFAKTGTQVSFSFFVKNIGGQSATVAIEMMVPDAITASLVTISPGTVTKVHGDVGTSGISSIPGTKRRIKFTRVLGVGTEEQWTITINYSSSKTSFLDGSTDEIAA